MKISFIILLIIMGDSLTLKTLVSQIVLGSNQLWSMRFFSWMLSLMAIIVSVGSFLGINANEYPLYFIIFLLLKVELIRVERIIGMKICSLSLSFFLSHPCVCRSRVILYLFYFLNFTNIFCCRKLFQTIMNSWNS